VGSSIDQHTGQSRELKKKKVIKIKIKIEKNRKNEVEI
jgi:hypothetical protein